MTKVDYAGLKIGDEPIHLETEPISRKTLALYAGASGDHNPMHIDIDYARQAGEKDVFAHGMLIMAYLAKSVTDWVPQSALRSFSTRFTAITRVGEKIICKGKIVDMQEEGGEKRVRLDLSATNESGESKAAGEAVVAL